MRPRSKRARTIPQLRDEVISGRAVSDTMEDIDAEWDKQAAKTLIGKRVLIGITSVDPEGTEIGRWQMHGIIRECVAEEGITVHLEGERAGEDYILPPATNAFIEAKPGTYQLPETGEMVDNLDFITTWEIHEPWRH